MNRSLFSLVPVAGLVLGLFVPVAPAVAPPALPDLKEFRTVETAITARVSSAAPGVRPAQPAYLGAHLDVKGGELVVDHVEPGSPAARAGLQVGDVVRKAAGLACRDVAALGELVKARAPGEELTFSLVRAGKDVEARAVLGATSRPLTPGQRAIIGVQTEAVRVGIRLTSVTAGLPADRAKLKVGDVLTKIDGAPVAGSDRLTALGTRQPGEVVTFTVQRDGKTFDVKARLVAERASGRTGGWDARRVGTFSKPAYRLAVVRIAYPDVKGHAKIGAKDWEDSLFSKGQYNGKSATGQRVHGSMNDYYLEQSFGKLRVEGKAFEWVTVKNKRADYGNNANRFALLTEALDLVHARDGKDALKSFDGVFFLYAGDRAQGRRGGLYWPHRASVPYKGARWSYFICPELAGRNMASISVIAHEFGHMLGLPDLYARPEVPGEEGLGVWCTMANGHGRDGKPLHFSAWCKVRMGWLAPAVLDPRVKQKLVLAPVTRTNKECFKVLVRPDGSEYLLLENRTRKGFEKDLPAEGLLIWRVVNNRPVLEESHGITTPDGPTRFLLSIPYPSPSNNAFTPLTTPSSKSPKGGGLPVHITNIRKLPDGRITFFIGYEYL